MNRLEPTCDTDGNLEYWTCDKCHMCFLDAYAERITTLNGVRLPAPGHLLTHVDAKEPTCTVDGSIEHWACTRCGKVFADAEGKQELSPAEVILPKLVRTDDLPQTGDTSHLMGWMALLGASCAGMLCLKRRRG